jgi:predicted negative regulator of RcsB-dependent stress response
VDDLQSEKEQLDEIRAWWSEYGKVVILGVVIAVGGLIGWNSYNDRLLATQVEASELFETLALHVTDGKLDDAEAVADDLVSNYANTTYAAQSRLAMARLYMDQNRDQDAADALNDLLAMGENDELKNVARLRMAHVLLYQDKPQDVVDLLTDLDVGAFNALYDEQLGDAYTSLGDFESAGDAYRRALADPSPNPVVDKGLVQMKLVDLPETVVAEASEEPVDEAVEEPAIEDGESE